VGCHGLLGCQHIECNEPGWVDSACVVQEDANDFLNATASGRVKLSSGVRIRDILNFGAVVRLGPGMGGMLWAHWVGMVELLQGTFNVPRHGHINCALVVIPGERKAAVLGGVPVLSDLVLLVEGRE